MTVLRQKMIDEMSLQRFSESTKKSYVQAVAGFAKHFNKSPEVLTDEDIRAYLLYLTNERKLAPNTINIAVSGILYLWTKVLLREWTLDKRISRRRNRRLPVIFSYEEVVTILGAVRSKVYQLAFLILYCCGLRVFELLTLKLGDIDLDRRQIRLTMTKSHKDRYVPFPAKLCGRIEKHLYNQNYKQWVFAKPKDCSCHIEPDTLRKSLKKVLEGCGINKKASLHTFRHTYATQLHERGVSIRQLQVLLGHKNIESTTIYTHLTKGCESLVVKVLNSITPPML